MSCPRWFPAAMLRRPEAEAARIALVATTIIVTQASIQSVVGLLIPLPQALGTAAAALSVGIDMAHADCDVPLAMCRWRRRTAADVGALLGARWAIDSAVAFVGGGVALAPAWAILQAFHDALMSGEAACLEIEDSDENDENDGARPMEPMLTDDEVVASIGTSRTSIFNAYSHAYQDAAEQAYAVDINVNLRPWLIAQTTIDIDFLRRLMVERQLAGRPDHAAYCLIAIRGLSNWLEAATTERPGAWSRATIRRVLRSSSLQTNLAVVVDDGSNNDESDSGGGIGAVVGIAIAAVGLLAVTR